MPQNANQNAGGRFVMPSTNAWPTERWTSVLILGALAALILLRMGFRGVNIMGASVSVG